MKSRRNILFSALTLFTLALSSASAFAETKEFDVYAVEINKTKYWLPSEVSQKKGAEFSLDKGAQFTVKKGDTVVFHPVSKIQGANNIHGFAIKEYNVSAL